MNVSIVNATSSSVLANLVTAGPPPPPKSLWSKARDNTADAYKSIWDGNHHGRLPKYYRTWDGRIQDIDYSLLGRAKTAAIQTSTKVVGNAILSGLNLATMYRDWKDGRPIRGLY